MTRPSRAINLMLFSASLAIMLLLLETAAYWLLVSTDQSGLDMPQIKADLLAMSRSGDQPGKAYSATSPEKRQVVIHPYMGFVRNYDVQQQTFNGIAVEGGVNPLGFFGEPPPRGKDSGLFVVGLFGGSVAAELHLWHEQALKEIFRDRPDAKGKQIRIVPVAKGGMKQPQQLIALSYLLAIGYHFDLVLNLDGFNEIALPATDNYPHDIHYSFPRSWRVLSARTLDPEAVHLTAQVNQCRHELAHYQQRLRNGFWQNSYSVLYAWQNYRVRKEADCLDLDSQLKTSLQTEKKDYKKTGPKEDFADVKALYRASAQLWRRSSEQMHAICENLGIEYLHFLQPNQYVANSKPMSKKEFRAAIAPADHPYRIAASQGYEDLITEGRLLSGQGIRYRDLTPLFRSERKAVYRDPCCHLNQYGMLRVIESIGNSVRTQHEDEEALQAK